MRTSFKSLAIELKCCVQDRWGKLHVHTVLSARFEGWATVQRLYLTFANGLLTSLRNLKMMSLLLGPLSFSSSSIWRHKFNRPVCKNRYRKCTNVQSEEKFVTNGAFIHAHIWNSSHLAGIVHAYINTKAPSVSMSALSSYAAAISPSSSSEARRETISLQIFFFCAAVASASYLLGRRQFVVVYLATFKLHLLTTSHFRLQNLASVIV